MVLFTPSLSLTLTLTLTLTLIVGIKPIPDCLKLSTIAHVYSNISLDWKLENDVKNENVPSSTGNSDCDEENLTLTLTLTLALTLSRKDQFICRTDMQ